MKLFQKVYIAIDLHSKHSMIGYMNEQGHYMGQQQVPTRAIGLINEVVAIPARYKYLTIEQSNMAFWAAEQLREHVDELIICDPRHNRLISRNENKNDNLDTLRLCKLLRMGELKAVWRPKRLGIRRLFYGQIKEYQRLIKTLSIHKRQLIDSLRHWGITRKVTPSDYKHPDGLLRQIEGHLLREEMAAKIDFIGSVEAQKERQKARFIQTGNQFWSRRLGTGILQDVGYRAGRSSYLLRLHSNPAPVPQSYPADEVLQAGGSQVYQRWKEGSQ